MKKINKIAVWGLAALAAAFTACEDNMITGEIDYPVENLSRLFAPVEFKEVKPMPDGFRIQWTPVDGAQGYIFQFCADSLFNEGSDEYYAGPPNASRVVLSDTLVTTATVDTITGLGLEQEYFIRMAAFAQGKEQSHWLVSDRSYKTEARVVPQVLKDVDRNEVYTNEATVSWYVDMLGENPMDQLIIKVSGEGTEETVINLDAATQMAGQYTFTGLLEATSYEVRGHNSAIEGEWGDYNTVSFRTKSGQGDAVRYDGSTDFNTFLANLPNASTVFIPVGTTVTCVDGDKQTNVLITKDVTIRGESAAGEDKPVISVKEFRIVGNVNSIVFENVKLDAGETGGSYVFNLHKEEGSVFAGCGELSFIDCEITGYANAIIRHQGNEGTGIDEVTVDNCYIHDFNLSGSSYALFMFKNADYYVGAFNITNSTFFNVGTNIIEHRLTDTAIHNCNATISDCTFQNCGSNSRTMFDFDKTATGTVTFENCVFGAIMDPSVHKGFRGSYVVTNVRNCYASDDFTFASSAGILGDIPKFGAPAADIFVDAAGGNLTLTGVAASYAGTIGDPRWY